MDVSKSIYDVLSSENLAAYTKKWIYLILKFLKYLKSK